jgi:diacylglycerol O-acyltransferase-1
VEAPVQNYRGFLNLAILMLIVSNIRLLVTSIDSHGFVIVRLWNHIKDLPHIRRDPWEEFPFVSGFLLQLVFIVSAYCIEWMLSRRKIPSVVGMFLHHCNAHAALIVPTIIVWKYIVAPPVGGILLLHATITWMKLISYMLANEDYRTQMVSLKDKNFQGHSSALALIEHLDEWDADIKYPKNITLRNLLYFWAAPTLTYQIAFPKIARIRWLKVGGIVMRMVLCLTIFGFLLAQIVSPILASLVQDLEANGGVYTVSMMADYGLKLAIANTYIWLLVRAPAIVLVF